MSGWQDNGDGTRMPRTCAACARLQRAARPAADCTCNDAQRAARARTRAKTPVRAEVRALQARGVDAVLRHCATCHEPFARVHDYQRLCSSCHAQAAAHHQAGRSTAITTSTAPD